jgi:hypothetical protein
MSFRKTLLFNDHIRVCWQIVNFGSGQDRNDVETAGAAALRRGF